MGDLFLLSERQMARISPFFPLAHGMPRVDIPTAAGFSPQTRMRRRE